MDKVKKSSDNITISLPRLSSLNLSKLNLSTTLLLLFVFAAGLIIGSLYTKVQYLEKNGGPSVAGAAATTDAAPAQQGAQPAPVTVTIDQIKALFTDKNITFGDVNNAANLIVEVADPSCPFCHVAAGKNPELNTEMGSQFTMVADGGSYLAPVPEIKKLVDSGKAAFVFLYTNGHGNGEMGTKAMYCAHETDDFWPVHDKLMTNEGYDLLNETVKNDKEKSGELAEFLSDATDAVALKTCLDSGKYDEKLQEDVAAASSIGATATPGFFINEKAFSGAYSWKDMQSSVK